MPTGERPRIPAISRGAALHGGRAAAMKRLRSFFWVLLLLATSAWRAEGQAAEPRTGFRHLSVPRTTSGQEALLSHPAASGWLDDGGTPTRAADLFAAEAESRPRWVFPAAGAAAGGAFATYLTYQACRDAECSFPVGPPLVGLALGALLGWSADLLSRPIR